MFVRLTLEVLLLELLSFSLFGGGGGGALEGEDPGATKGLAGTSGGRTPLPPLPPFELPEAVLLLGDESESALPLTSALRLTGKKASKMNFTNNRLTSLRIFKLRAYFEKLMEGGLGVLVSQGGQG